MVDHVRVRVLMEPAHGGTYAAIRALACAVEAAGFDGFFRSDHLMGVDPDDPTYRPSDSWTTLSALARDTTRVRLGTLVGAATFREPGLLAAIVATVADLSGGRVELGLGTGWYEREHRAFGVGFPPTGERFDRLAEQLEIVTGMWRTAPGAAYSFDGRYWTVAENATPPRPDPTPPVIVGGTGPRRTPALAARYADEFNAGITAADDDPAVLGERFAVVDAACVAIGRDPATLRHSAMIPVACAATEVLAWERAEAISSPLLRAAATIGPPAQLTERIADLAAAGAETVYLQILDIHDLDHIALIGAEVLPHLSRSGARA